MLHRNRSIFIVIWMILAIVILALMPKLLAHWQRQSPEAHVTSTAASYPVTVKDVRGLDITIKKRPLKIISISPAVTEILFAIGAGDRVIADTRYCDYPPAAGKLTKIGGYLDPNVEKILTLAPDLVLAARGTPREPIDRLSSLGLNVAVVDPVDIGSTLRTIRLIGRIVGDPESANSLAARIDARRSAVVAKTGRIPASQRPRVLFLFDLNGLFTAGPKNHIDDLIHMAGGTNIADSTGVPWPELSMEKIIAADPQVILLMEGHGTNANYTTDSALKILRADHRWINVSAVANGRIVVLDDDEITLPGPRMIDGLESAATALHPGLFPKGTKR